MHPEIFKIGNLTGYSYGLFMALAFCIGIFIARKEAKRKKIEPEHILDLAFFIIVGSIIGARLYYILFYNPAIFIKTPLEIFKVWRGGLAIHGGILGGLLAGVLFCKIRKISLWRLSDTISPSIILGQAIGRIGCFLNGCCYGIPTKFFLGIRFPKGSLPDLAYGGLRVHPTQLYEAILDFISFLILWALRKKVKFDGELFLLYLMSYSVIRLSLSNLRGDSLYLWETDIRVAQVVSIIIFLISLGLFLKKVTKKINFIH